MRPQWEGGRWRKEGAVVQVKAAVTLPKEHPPPPLIPPLPFTSLVLILTFSSPAPPPLPPSLFFPSPLFSSLTPFSLQMPDTAHDLSFVYQQRFKGKSGTKKTPNMIHKFGAALLVCPFYFPLHEPFCVYFGINL